MKWHQPGKPCCDCGCSSPTLATFCPEGCCGTPVVGATVTVTGPRPRSSSLTCTTEAEVYGGSACCTVDLAPLGPGTYDWTVEAEGYITASGEFTIECGGTFVWAECLEPDSSTFPDAITLVDPLGLNITLTKDAPLGVDLCFRSWSGSHTYSGVEDIVGLDAYGDCVGGQTGDVTVQYTAGCNGLNMRVPVYGPSFAAYNSLASDACGGCSAPIFMTGLISSYCRPIAGSASFPVHCFNNTFDDNCCPIGTVGQTGDCAFGAIMSGCDLAKIWFGGSSFSWHS
jgi:hypothetical protein